MSKDKWGIFYKNKKKLKNINNKCKKLKVVYKIPIIL